MAGSIHVMGGIPTLDVGNGQFVAGAPTSHATVAVGASSISASLGENESLRITVDELPSAIERFEIMINDTTVILCTHCRGYATGDYRPTHEEVPVTLEASITYSAIMDVTRGPAFDTTITVTFDVIRHE